MRRHDAEKKKSTKARESAPSNEEEQDEDCRRIRESAPGRRQELKNVLTDEKDL